MELARPPPPLLLDIGRPPPRFAFPTFREDDNGSYWELGDVKSANNPNGNLECNVQMNARHLDIDRTRLKFVMSIESSIKYSSIGRCVWSLMSDFGTVCDNVTCLVIPSSLSLSRFKKLIQTTTTRLNTQAQFTRDYHDQWAHAKVLCTVLVSSSMHTQSYSPQE